MRQRKNESVLKEVLKVSEGNKRPETKSKKRKPERIKKGKNLKKDNKNQKRVSDYYGLKTT
ncbi:hypothetical protein [Brotaphodocola sp.]|uniref:hypothetical protein n=1 Tax=Brotaphodocola sp. TaxID=3073577 RepID=UPI003D7EE3CA